MSPVAWLQRTGLYINDQVSSCLGRKVPIRRQVIPSIATSCFEMIQEVSKVSIPLNSDSIFREENQTRSYFLHKLSSKSIITELIITYIQTYH